MISGNIYCQNFSVGARTGLNVMPLENNDSKGHLYSLGYHVGATVDYKINNWFSVSAELVYTTRKKTYELYDTASFIETISNNPLLGFLGIDINDVLDSLGGIENYINDNVYNTTKGFVNLAYIKIPVLAKFNYKALYMSVGPYISFLVSDKTTEEFSQHIPIIETMTGLDTIPFYTSIVDGSFPGYSTPVITNIKGNKNIRKVDFGIVADISYRLDNNFAVGFRYTQGLLNYRSPEIYKKDYLSSFNFFIGYIFNIKKDTKSLY
jgi:hypothetical protein